MHIRRLLVVFIAALALSSPAYAADAGRAHPSDAARSHAGGPPPHVSNADRGRRGPPEHALANRPTEQRIAQVPELGGASAGLAFLLLGGLIALRRETRKAS